MFLIFVVFVLLPSSYSFCCPYHFVIVIRLLSSLSGRHCHPAFVSSAYEMATRDRAATDDYEWFSKAMDLMRVRAREFAPNLDTEVGVRVPASLRAHVCLCVLTSVRSYVCPFVLPLSRFSIDFYMRVLLPLCPCLSVRARARFVQVCSCSPA